MPLTLRDDLNRLLTLATPARRIVSLSPAATENLFAIGAGRFVVGVTAADTYPPEAAKLPRVGDFGAPRYETLRALQPDLIIAESGTLRADVLVGIAQRAKAPVFAQVSVRYADVEKHLRQLAALAGLPRGADKPVAALRAAEAEARRAAKGKSPVTAFLEVSRSPLYAAAPGSFMDDCLTIAGGENVVNGRDPYPMVSRESLLLSDPQVYITTFGGAAETIRRGEPLAAPLNRIRAAKTNRVVALPVDLLFRPTPRLARGLLLLSRVLHGE